MSRGTTTVVDGGRDEGDRIVVHTQVFEALPSGVSQDTSSRRRSCDPSRLLAERAASPTFDWCNESRPGSGAHCPSLERRRQAADVLPPNEQERDVCQTPPCT
jgi:hypothetical protein